LEELKTANARRDRGEEHTDDQVDRSACKEYQYGVNVGNKVVVIVEDDDEDDNNEEGGNAVKT
jgi:hypothetical protein